MSVEIQAERWGAHYNNVNIQLCNFLFQINYTEVWVGGTCKVVSTARKPLVAQWMKMLLSSPDSLLRAPFASACWGIVLASVAPQTAGRVTEISGPTSAAYICGPKSQLQTAQQKDRRNGRSRRGRGFGVGQCWLDQIMVAQMVSRHRCWQVLLLSKSEEHLQTSDILKKISNPLRSLMNWKLCQRYNRHQNQHFFYHQSCVTHTNKTWFPEHQCKDQINRINSAKYKKSLWEKVL